MIEAYVRGKIQPLFTLLGRLIFVPLKVSPNMLTACAFASGIAAAFFISNNQLMFGLCMLFVSGLCDIMDGTVARLNKAPQKIGAYIDLISDGMVEASLILGFAFSYPQHYLAYIVFLIALLLQFSTFLAAGALFANTGPKSMHHEHSFVERAESFIVFTLMLLFPAYIFELLMSFSIIALFDGFARFVRVVRSA